MTADGIKAVSRASIPPQVDEADELSPRPAIRTRSDHGSILEGQQQPDAAAAELAELRARVAAADAETAALRDAAAAAKASARATDACCRELQQAAASSEEEAALMATELAAVKKELAAARAEVASLQHAQAARSLDFPLPADNSPINHLSAQPAPAGAVAQPVPDARLDDDAGDADNDGSAAITETFITLRAILGREAAASLFLDVLGPDALNSGRVAPSAGNRSGNSPIHALQQLVFGLARRTRQEH
jgi:hypothetical protein